MIRFEDVSFHYGGQRGTGEGVDHLNLRVAPGELVVLVGRSGCGKTTVTRLINGLAPHFYEGVVEGAVYVNDVCVTTSDLSKTHALVGSVFQNPKSQFFNVDTTGELAFGCENQALPREEIHARVMQTCEDMKLHALMNRNIFDLSGGEKQQIACGSAYAAQPLVFVLDEPSSNLDRKAIRRLHDMLVRVKDQGRTVVVSEHRIYYLMDVADRIIYMDDGYIVAEYTPDELRALSEDELHSLGLRTPDLEDLRGSSGVTGGKGEVAVSSKPSVEAVDLSCYRGGNQIIDIERLALPENSVIALIGDNGCGKSTLSEALCGVVPSNGSVAFDGEFFSNKQRSHRSFMVMQDVNRQLFSETVLEEVMLNSDISEADARAILEQLDLGDTVNRHPASLSGGQKQRVAIASALCAGKDIVFYDEPTSGLDRAGMERFAALLKSMRDRVKTQVIVTHDPELIMQSCTHALRMDNGRVTGLYPLDEDGRQRVLYYFTSEDDGSTSRRRTRVTPLGKILSYTGRFKRTTVAAAAFMTLGAIFQVLPFLIVYWLISRALAGSPPTVQEAALPLVGILVCLVLYAILYIYGLQLSHRSAFGTLENLRCSLQEKLEVQPLGSVADMGTGALKKLFVDDVESIELLLAHMIPEGIANIAVPTVVMLIMMAVDWRLALLTLIMIAFGVSASGQMYGVGTKFMGSYFAATKRLNNTIIEYVNGMDVVRMFNRDSESLTKFEQAVHGYRDFALAWYKVCWPWMAVYGSIFFTCTLFTLPFGAFLVLLGQLELQNYVLCLCLSFGIGPLLVNVMQFASAIPQVNMKIQTLEKSLDRLPLRVSENDYTGTSHTVEFSDVHFGYGNDEVLKGVSFTAEEGQMTALVGPSGSGKSTIAKCLTHYYDVESGTICLGGQNICDMSLEALYSQLSYVSQEQFLFNKSILENIRVGKPEARNEEVFAAARAAQCDEFVLSLPDAYHTQAGAAGGMLSGGQRQRIAFARALLKDAPVLVLDEATAHIDPENAEKMNAAVAELTRNKTLVVIAHRLSSIVNADKIVVLDGGRVVDEGRHDELLARCAIYRTLWTSSEQVDSWALNSDPVAVSDVAVSECGASC